MKKNCLTRVRTMNKPDGLTPTRVVSKVIAVPGTIGKTKREDLLISGSGKVIAQDIPTDWINYIHSAVNNYDDMQAYDNGTKTVSDQLITSFRLEGKPVAKASGKQVGRDQDGNYVMSASPDYARRIREVKRNRPHVRYGRTQKPIDIPVHVQCVFYLNKSNGKICVPEMVASTLDLLVKLGIIKSDTNDIVASTDGSHSRYILNEPYTMVTIRKMRSDYA